jgi:ribosomal RNA-processing protein 8
MGTNLADFIREAHRVLKDNGRVKIAEVRSRIEYSHSTTSSTNNKNKGNNKYKNSKDNTNSKNKNGNETIEGTLKEFIGVLDKLGFQCVTTDRSNTMFLLLDLKKNGKRPDRKLEFSAKPCIYKRR